jgi:DNA-binding transcriptional MerR regulator
MVGWAARTVRRLDVLAESGYFFPVRATRDRPTKNPHADAGFINHALQYMPGVDMSCHGWRRGFARHGQRELGFSVEDIKMILDHSEGAPSGDVTASNYSLDPMIAKKRQMMEKWIAWLELQVKAAIALGPSLLDAEAVGEAIFRARYGDERWEKRVARTTKHGVGVDNRCSSMRSHVRPPRNSQAGLKSALGRADLSHTLGMRGRSPCVRKRP